MSEALHYYSPDLDREYRALRHSAALIDLGFRSRLCLLGADARRFLNGQVTNNVKDLAVGQGCYAALVSAKGKMDSDVYIYRLENEILLDFERGLADAVKQRLEKFVIAEDVQIVDVAPLYALLRIQGPKAADALAQIPWLHDSIPAPQSNQIKPIRHQEADFYLAAPSPSPAPAFDLFIPAALLEATQQALATAIPEHAGWQALETVRLESTMPRFGLDMDQSTLPPEAGLETRAISYAKGCYIGQEVISRIRTYGQVARALRGLKVPGAPQPPEPGAKIFHLDKEVGRVTSAAFSPLCQMPIALATIRREANALGTQLTVEHNGARLPATVATQPFDPFTP